MKVLIAADMEGISGVIHWDQVTPGHPDYDRFRRLMTADVNAAISGVYIVSRKERRAGGRDGNPPANKRLA